MRLKLDCILINTIMVLLNQKYHGNRKELNNGHLNRYCFSAVGHEINYRAWQYICCL